MASKTSGAFAPFTTNVSTKSSSLMLKSSRQSLLIAVPPAEDERPCKEGPTSGNGRNTVSDHTGEISDREAIRRIVEQLSRTS